MMGRGMIGMNVSEGQRLYSRAKRIIPGGTQLLSKRPEQYAPGLWPPYAKRAKGCVIQDIDGNSYIDMTTMGIGTCVLGYADDAVDTAVKDAVDAGSMCTLNFAEEVELAELLLALHPWAEKVRYARTGGEAMAQAIRIARAATGRERIVFCGYHGWHDWYLAGNLSGKDGLGDHLLKGLEPAGVPSGLSGTAIPFHYNDMQEFDAALSAGDVAAVVMEPIRYTEPRSGFLSHVRVRTRESGAVLICDEVTSGWRFATGGVHTLFGITPDMAVYAKAMGNGYPCGAVVGIGEVMEAAQSTFISSTYWTERIGSAASLATIHELMRRNAPAVLAKAGEAVQRSWRDAAGIHGLDITIEGRPALCRFAFSHDESDVLQTVLTQELLLRGILGNTSFYASLAHTDAEIERYAEALHEVFGIIARAVDSGNARSFLRGEVAVKGFTRLT